MTANALTPIQHTRISSNDLPARDKASALRELLGRELMRVDLEPADADARPIEAFGYNAAVSTLAEGTAYAHVKHTPVHYRRTAALMRDGLDDVFLSATYGGQGGCVLHDHRGVEVVVPSGGIALLSKARLHEGITPWGGTSTCIQMPREALARLLPGLGEAPMHVFAPGAPGTASAALALAYAELVVGQPGLAGAPLASSVAHLHELLAAAIAPHLAGGLPLGAQGQGVPLLAIIQRDIRTRLDQPGLNLAAIARLRHLTPRQVQRLFRQQGQSFSTFLAEERMQRARAMLADPAQRHRRVLQIALDSGFDDIPAFSRAFRRRFGMTPSEAREQQGAS